MGVGGGGTGVGGGRFPGVLCSASGEENSRSLFFFFFTPVCMSAELGGDRIKLIELICRDC